ncbi:hypothetical protein [Peristeroidobacter soli]|jgi:hypothetical protein|uniref:hypothetical protein n=1 Tax=Peristeroidobacter soli TaxID=2497877 RepID=UPI00101C6CCE|nr:hypothetical protein [Peristeroidobacter soli]
MNISKPSAVVIATVAIGGCAETPLADADYGNSFRQLVQAQTLDAVAASNPPEFAPEMTDAARLENALDIYRKDVAKGNTEVKRPIVFEVGTN